MVAVGPPESAQIIKTDTMSAQHLMGTLRRHLPNVERITDNEMVNGVSAAKIEAERLQWQQPPDI